MRGIDAYNATQYTIRQYRRTILGLPASQSRSYLDVGCVLISNHSTDSAKMLNSEVGQSIPLDTPHVSNSFLSVRSTLMAGQAVSVSLPSWASCVSYEEGEDWILKRMNNGYPR